MGDTSGTPLNRRGAGGERRGREKGRVRLRHGCRGRGKYPPDLDHVTWQMRSRSTLHQLVLAIRKRNTFIHHHHMNIQAETFSIYVITQLVAGSRYKTAKLSMPAAFVYTPLMQKKHSGPKNKDVHWGQSFGKRKCMWRKLSVIFPRFSEHLYSQNAEQRTEMLLLKIININNIKKFCFRTYVSYLRSFKRSKWRRILLLLLLLLLLYIYYATWQHRKQKDHDTSIQILDITSSREYLIPTYNILALDSGSTIFRYFGKRAYFL